MQFGAYRVIEPVAKDARADVYLAVPDAGFASRVVLRVIPASSFENEAARTEFTRSVKLYATLSHSAVVQTYDLFSENGNLVVVMEYVEGTALDDFLETLRAMDTPMTDAAALFVGLRVVGALAAAHAVRDPTDLSLSPIVHGDVRPETILIPWDGYVRLADFRAAKTTTTFRARPGGVSRHAAPEVMREGRASTSSDVYSAALVVWELLTQRQAFPPSLGGAELMRALASPTIPRLATVRPDLPRKLVETLDRALEPRAEDRTVTAAQLLAVLRSSFVPEEGETWIIRTLAHIQAGPTIRRAPESAPLVTDADLEEALSADATQKRKTSSTSLRAMPDESQPIGLLAWSDDATTAAVAVPSTARLPPKMQKTAPMKNAPPLPPRAASKTGATPAPPNASAAPLGAKARTTMAIAGGPPASPRPPSKPPPVPAGPPAAQAPVPHEGREITLALAAPVVAEALAPTTQKSARGDAPPAQPPPPPPAPVASPAPTFATDPAPPPLMSVPPEIIHVPSPAVPQVEVWQPGAFPSQQPPAYAPLPTVSIPRSVPPPLPKKTSSAVWLVPLGILVFGGLGVTAYAFRDRLLPPKVAATPPKPSPSASVAASASAPIAVRTAAPIASAPPSVTASATAAPDAGPPVASASASTTGPAIASAAPSASASAKTVPSAPSTATSAPPVATAPPPSDLVADATHCVMHTRDAQPGHRIYYDNRVVGETPASVVVRCGVHEVKLGSAGYLRKPDLPCGGELSLK